MMCNDALDRGGNLEMVIPASGETLQSTTYWDDVWSSGKKREGDQER